MNGRARPRLQVAVPAVALGVPILVALGILMFVAGPALVAAVGAVLLTLVGAAGWLLVREAHLASFAAGHRAGYRAGHRAGHDAGVRAGIVAERAEERRRLHDGPLQTLEAIALEPPFAPDPRLELDRVRSAARAEALRLRTHVQAPAAATGAGASLPDSLAALAAEFAEDGLAVQLTAAEHEVGAITAEQRAALCAAAREALTNVIKHAHTRTAVLRLDCDEQTVRVIVRDHGVGMVPGTPAGFGQAESLVARMSDVGGRAEIWSRPGTGTRVTLEVDST